MKLLQVALKKYSGYAKLVVTPGRHLLFIEQKEGVGVPVAAIRLLLPASMILQHYVRNFLMNGIMIRTMNLESLRKAFLKRVGKKFTGSAQYVGINGQRQQVHVRLATGVLTTETIKPNIIRVETWIAVNQ